MFLDEAWSFAKLVHDAVLLLSHIRNHSKWVFAAVTQAYTLTVLSLFSWSGLGAGFVDAFSHCLCSSYFLVPHWPSEALVCILWVHL
eukprot:671284-Amphidinium_carterae.1